MNHYFLDRRYVPTLYSMHLLLLSSMNDIIYAKPATTDDQVVVIIEQFYEVSGSVKFQIM